MPRVLGRMTYSTPLKLSLSKRSVEVFLKLSYVLNISLTCICNTPFFSDFPIVQVLLQTTGRLEKTYAAVQNRVENIAIPVLICTEW